MWSHNKRKYPHWLIDLRARAWKIKSQGFIWWSVGWRINFDQFIFPVTGYVWNTVEKEIPYRTLIGHESKTLCQPERELAKQALENWKRLNVYVHNNSPVVEYQRGERKIVTLLKLINLEELATTLKLEDFKLWDGTPIPRPPQSYYRIILP